MLDDASFARLDHLRRLHFPAALNKIPAHISLFHHLPGHELRQVQGQIEALCRNAASFSLRPTKLVNLGRGVAIAYEAGALGPFHASLAAAFAGWLTPQDRQPFRPHVTIQNKASAAEARALLAAMQRETLPSCRIEGAAIWAYRGGPWEPVATCRFGDPQKGEITA